MAQRSLWKHFTPRVFRGTETIVYPDILVIVTGLAPRQGLLFDYTYYLGWEVLVLDAREYAVRDAQGRVIGFTTLDKEPKVISRRRLAAGVDADIDPRTALLAGLEEILINLAFLGALGSVRAILNSSRLVLSRALAVDTGMEIRQVARSGASGGTTWRLPIAGGREVLVTYDAIEGLAIRAYRTASKPVGDALAQASRLKSAEVSGSWSDDVAIENARSMKVNRDYIETGRFVGKDDYSEGCYSLYSEVDEGLQALRQEFLHGNGDVGRQYVLRWLREDPASAVQYFRLFGPP
jgi:hypothetical protein